MRWFSGTTISVTLNSDRFSALSFVNSRGYKIGQIGSFVRIPVSYFDLYGVVVQRPRGGQVEATPVALRRCNSSSSSG